MCIWPQQVWPSGKTTSWPSRSSSRTVALAAAGNIVSARQVTNKAMRMSGLQPALGRLPRGRVAAWLVAHDLLSLPQQGPQRREVSADCPGRAGLHEDVAERGRLDRTGQHGQPAGVRGELAEQLVAGATTDDVHRVDVPAGQLLGLA